MGDDWSVGARKFVRSGDSIGDNVANMISSYGNMGRPHPLRAKRYLGGRRKRLLGVALAFAGHVSTLQAQTSPLSLFTQKQSASVQTAPANPAPAAAEQGTLQVIPLPDVTLRSQQLAQVLRNLAASLPSTNQLTDMNQAIKDRQVELQAKQNETRELLAAMPNSVEIRDYEQYWKATQSYVNTLNQQLLAWGNTAQAAVQQLDQIEPQWAATLDANRSNPTLGPVLDLIHENLAHIRKLKAQANDELQAIVRMQIASSELTETAADTLAALQGASAALKGNILQRDSLPLWKVFSRRQTGENPSLYASAKSRLSSTADFMGSHSGALIVLALLLLGTLVTSYRLHKAVEGTPPSETASSALLLVIHRWISLGVLPVMVLSLLFAPAAPLPLLGLGVLLGNIPVLRLLSPLIEPRFRIMLYSLTGVYALNVVLSWIAFSPTVKRELYFLTMATVFLIVAYLVRPTRAFPDGGNKARKRSLLFAVRSAVAVLGVSLTANFFGYVKLAQYLAVACVYSSFIAIFVLTAWRVFVLLLRAGVALPQSEQLALVRKHREAVARWAPRITLWCAVLVWLAATLDLLNAREAVQGALWTVLRFPIAGKGSNITLGEVLGFFLILAVGYAISSSIRFLIRDEVLSRFHLSRGLPELISTTIHYLLLVLVVLYAVKVGNVELNKFTVLTGALGVGVGFGLQNIINNFVSGLILQFERPIHIGDVLEIDPTAAGTVTRIGIRSSTILTAQGAEIIVPNANLISNRVTNWTLTEAQRRVELPIGVAYGADLKSVMCILKDAAAMHPDVLAQPEPVAYFKGFGESSLDFELQFWVMIQSNWVRVKSEVALAVSNAFDKAKIEIPFPQRDLHLRGVDAEAAELLSRNGSSPVTVKARVATVDTSSAVTEPTRRE